MTHPAALNLHFLPEGQAKKNDDQPLRSALTALQHIKRMYVSLMSLYCFVTQPFLDLNVMSNGNHFLFK